MRERPILFSGPMVRAILDGTKTQTRRIVKNEFGACAACFSEGVPHNQGDGGMGVFGTDPYLRVAYCDHSERCGGRTRCPYGAPGDRLWVRERQRVVDFSRAGFVRVRVRYEADSAESGWLPYPDRLDGKPEIGKCLAYGGYRESSRLSLDVTSVRVERLQDIAEADAFAEGIDPEGEAYGRAEYFQAGGSPIEGGSPAVCAFAGLWDRINGKRAPWESNPWVWVVGFKRVEAPL